MILQAAAPKSPATLSPSIKRQTESTPITHWSTTSTCRRVLDFMDVARTPQHRDDSLRPHSRNKSPGKRLFREVLCRSPCLPTRLPGQGAPKLPQGCYRRCACPSVCGGMSASTGVTRVAVAAHMWIVPLMIMKDPQICTILRRSRSTRGGGRGGGSCSDFRRTTVTRSNGCRHLAREKCHTLEYYLSAILGSIVPQISLATSAKIIPSIGHGSKPTCAVRMRQPLGSTNVSAVANALRASGKNSRDVRCRLPSTILLKISL